MTANDHLKVSLVYKKKARLSKDFFPGKGYLYYPLFPDSFINYFGRNRHN
jgi:hypothetical protein